MQALKALVILMAVLILAGMGLLVYGLVTQGGKGEAGNAGAEMAAGFGALDLPVPEGCSIAGTELAGSRLVLRFDGLAERGCQQVVIVDLASGRILGRVKALPGAAE
jgi:hypothetical protein